MQISETIWCDGCGVEVTWTPIRSNHHDYCCQDCADGYECNCAARTEEDDYARSRGSGEGGMTVEDGF